MITAIDLKTGKPLLLDIAKEEITPTLGSHSTLTDRTIADQHPIGSITGLETRLSTNEEDIATLKNDRDDLGDQVHSIQADVNSLKDTSVTLTGEQTLSNKSFKDSLKAVGDETIGETFEVSFLAGTAQLATNNGLDILSETNFLTNPQTEATTDWDSLAPSELPSKSQVAQAISEVTGSHFDKWVAMGAPEALTLTETLQKVYIPATTRFPNIPPATFELTEDGTGITFKKAGLIHLKRNVSLSGANQVNLYYEARINDQQLAPLQTQAVSVSENTMSFSIEFYWQVTANQTISIWANCLTGTAPLNYKGVCTMVEYL